MLEIHHSGPESSIYIYICLCAFINISVHREAAKCNKGLTVLYAVCVEDFLLLCVRVLRGPKLADSMLLNIGHVLHCRICEDRAFYPDGMAPVGTLLNCLSRILTVWGFICFLQSLEFVAKTRIVVEMKIKNRGTKYFPWERN